MDLPFECPCGDEVRRDPGHRVTCSCGRTFIAVVGGDWLEVTSDGKS